MVQISKKLLTYSLDCVHDDGFSIAQKRFGDCRSRRQGWVFQIADCTIDQSSIAAKVVASWMHMQTEAAADGNSETNRKPLQRESQDLQGPLGNDKVSRGTAAK